MNLLTDCAKDSRRSNAIDALRALLALWVLLTHLIPWTGSIQGSAAIPQFLTFLNAAVIALTQSSFELHPAVVGFIIVSGYCIHRSGFRREPGGEISYLVRRAARILPIFYLGLAAGVLYVILADHADPGAYCLFGHATALASVIPAFTQCPMGNATLATVKNEIVLYVLYLLGFRFFVWRGRERMIWIISAATFAASLVVAGLARVDFSFYNWWQNWSAVGFIGYWWLGAALVNRNFSSRVVAGLPVLIVAFVLMTAIILWFTPSALSLLSLSPSHTQNDVASAIFVLAEIRKLVLALLFGCLIIRLDRASLGRWNPIAILGRASYGLYALQAPLSVALCYAGWRWYLIIAANLVIALVVHVIIEQPFIRLAKGRNQTSPARQSIHPNVAT